ncbi:malto-oligosyltrehalose synthase, partial [bacterium]|nr:malto-oligosyltrehalose synthase [bacterium]
MTADRARVPLATYRLQLTGAFTFDDAANLADYLRDLGVTHLYLSPILQAAPQSVHGYDVVDHARISGELGGADGFRRLCAASRRAGLGQVLDIVPNHMSISHADNRWWFDVLENGPSSQYASFFDVDWDPPELRAGNKILMPILGDHYGRVLEAGEIRLVVENDRLLVGYHDHRLPLDPSSLAPIVGEAADAAGSDELAFLAGAFGRLPVATATDRASTTRRHRDKEVLHCLLARLAASDPAVAAAIGLAIKRRNDNVDLLDELLDRQNYRLAHWRTAGRELGYRRFFDINELVALRVEDDQVFIETHRLIVGWLRDGAIDGVRVDHPDGLRDPEPYFRRLRDAAPDAWIVAEKILQPGERLPETWPVAGTTGYDFLNTVRRPFCDPAAERTFVRFHEDFTGEPGDFAATARDRKHQVLREMFGSDMNRLTELLMRVIERHRRVRDYTRPEADQALRELATQWPVYRTYIRPETGRVEIRDRRIVRQAIRAAKAARPDIDPRLFDFLADVLNLRERGLVESDFVARFQQMTGPVAAKGIEDTALYNDVRFIAANEVGGDPAHFATSVGVFHLEMFDAAEWRPASMLATSTHDTKRGEDVRARLAVLSEMPREFFATVRRFAKANERHRKDGAPARRDEYLYYQTLVGAWPLDAERAVAYMRKAAREAKRETSWLRVNEAYENALESFARATLADAAFVADLETFVASILAPGRINALAQALVKFTAPGVPDIYQGCELWDLSLVDPDNRRPVDFEKRRAMLTELPNISAADAWSRADEGWPKLLVTHRALALRREHPKWFGPGADYR